MSEVIGIFGESGRGKSTAARTLDPETTFYINITGKSLPFRGWKKNYDKFHPSKNPQGNYTTVSSHNRILEVLDHIDENMDHITDIVIDDFQYLMSFEFMKRANENGWDKFTEMANHAFKVMQKAGNLREDLLVYILCHTQTNTKGLNTTKSMKTIGKMLDEKIVPEGLLTVVLFTDFNRNAEEQSDRYRFATQTDGETTAKSPMGMFDKMYIPNDLALVSKKVREYYYGEPINA